MTQSTLNINPSTTNGTQLASLLNTFASAVHSTNLGPTPPLYAENGTIWCDNSANNYVFKVRKDNTWVTLYTITPEGLAEFAGLNKVAYTGKYADLGDLPYIPTSYGYRNLLINGSFRINQLYSSTVASSVPLGHYVIDGWQLSRRYMDTNVTFSKVECTPGELDSVSPVQYSPGSQFWLKVATTVGDNPSEGTGLGISQKIDRLKDFGNRTMCLSLVGKADVPHRMNYAIYGNCGTGGSPIMSIHGGYFDIIPEPGYFTTSFNVPGLSGKIFGPGMNLRIELSTPYIEANNLYITCVQLELGSVPSAYEIEPPSIELTRCQRFIQKSYPKDDLPGTVSENGSFILICGAPSSGDSVIDFTYKLTTPMISAPTVTSYDNEGNIGKCRLFPGYPLAAETNQNCELLSSTPESFQIHKIGRTTSNKGFNGIQLHFTAISYL